MKDHSVWYPFIGSFFSKSLYRDVAHNWRGAGFSYLLLLLAICWLPVMIFFGYGFSHFSQSASAHLEKNIPKINITNGVVSIDKPVPYLIKDQDNKLIAVIDTNSDNSKLINSPAQFVLTKTKFFVKDNANQTRVYTIPSTLNVTFGPEQVKSGFHFLGRWLAITAYPFMVLFSFVYRIIQVLIYAAIGFIFCSIFRVRLYYDTLLRIAVIAVTPAIIISTILTLVNVSFPFEYLFYFILSMFYLAFGIKVNKSEAGLMAST